MSSDYMARDVNCDPPTPEETDETIRADCGHFEAESRCERIDDRLLCPECAVACMVAKTMITSLLAACNRLLDTEREILAMPAEQRDWFMGKPGHRDCFTVAAALKEILVDGKRSGPKLKL